MNAWMSPGPSRCEQLALAEHDRRLVAHAARDVAAALDRRRRRASSAQQEARAAREQRRADRDRGGEREPRRSQTLWPLAFLISARIAGTTSCRSPITA